MLPAEVERWRILLEKVDESVWSTDKYIWETQKLNSEGKAIHTSYFTSSVKNIFISYHIFCLIVVHISWLPGKLCLWCALEIQLHLTGGAAPCMSKQNTAKLTQRCASTKKKQTNNTNNWGSSSALCNIKQSVSDVINCVKHQACTLHETETVFSYVHRKTKCNNVSKGIQQAFLEFGRSQIKKISALIAVTSLKQLSAHFGKYEIYKSQLSHVHFCSSAMLPNIL